MKFFSRASYLVCITGLLLLVTSCAEKGEEKDSPVPDVPKDATTEEILEVLPGLWESTTIHVEMETFDGTALNQVSDIKEDDWAEELRREHLMTTYDPNGTFQWEYFDLDRDSIVKSPMMFWELKGDSLYTTDPEYQNNFIYKVILHGDSVMEFRSKVDWDFDGKKDDLYYGKARKVR